MTTTMMHEHRDRRASCQRGFTLIELLVVMGVIAILGVLTTMSFRGIAADSKLASGKNTVSAVLDNARGLAMKENRLVMVVFRPRLNGPQKQHLEAIFAVWQSAGVADVAGSPRVVDRYVPLQGATSRNLPAGIKVALPGYGSDFDLEWHVGSHLPAINQNSGMGERAGEQIAVLFAPDGTTLTQNPATDAVRSFIDYNGNGFQDMATGSVSPVQIDYETTPNLTIADFNGNFPNHHGLFENVYEHDEPYVEFAPILAVFNDDEVREYYNPQDWQSATTGAFLNRRNDYIEYINTNVDPIYFNRYTGVAMK